MMTHSIFHKVLSSIVSASFIVLPLPHNAEASGLPIFPLSQSSLTLLPLAIEVSYDSNGKQTSLTETQAYKDWVHEQQKKAEREARARAEVALRAAANSNVVYDQNGNRIGQVVNGVYVPDGQQAPAAVQMKFPGMYGNIPANILALIPSIALPAIQKTVTAAPGVSNAIKNLPLTLNLLIPGIAPVVSNNVPVISYSAKQSPPVTAKFVAPVIKPIAATPNTTKPVPAQVPMGTTPVSNADFQARLRLMLQSFIPFNINIPIASLSNAPENAIIGLPPGAKVAHYGDDGRLVSVDEYKVEASADATHFSLTTKFYDKDGYLTQTKITEKVHGPNEVYTKETTIEKDGTATEHIKGKIKDPAQKYDWREVDETRVTKIKGIKGGFIVETQVTDNLTGLKSTITDKYTNCRYIAGQLVEFNLVHEVKGQRAQDGRVDDINILETTRQYAAQVDKEGRLISYKQDFWTNKAPDKNTTMRFTNNSFDDQQRPTSITSETWEKGKSVDGNGNPITLDSYTVSEKTNIQYNSSNQMTGYTETTYTQKKNPTLEEYAHNKKRERMGGYGSYAPPEMSPEEAKSYEKFYHEDYNNTYTTNNGIQLVGKEGYHWESENTSMSDMCYDYAGRMNYWKNTQGDPNARIYDINGLVDSEKVRDKDGNKSRNSQFIYDGVGRETYHHSITYTEDDIKLREGHWSEYNSLGQVISRTDTYRGASNRVEICEGYRTTYTYDEMGNQKQIERKELFNDTHTRWTTLQVVEVVVAIIVACVISYCYPPAGGFCWQQVALLAGEFAITYACEKGDGINSSDALKTAGITTAITAITCGMNTGSEATVTNSFNVEIAAAAVDVGTQAGAQAVAQATFEASIKTAAMTFLKNWALNTLSAIAQGADTEDAMQKGVLMAFAAMVMGAIVEGLNNIPALDQFITAGSELANQNPAFWKALTEQLVMKYASIQANEHNDPFIAGLVTGISQAILSSVLNGIEASLNNEEQGTSGSGVTPPAWMEFLKLDSETQNAVLKGMVKGAFYEWLEEQKEDGKLSDEDYALLEGAGLEFIDSVNYSAVYKELVLEALVKPLNFLIDPWLHTSLAEDERLSKKLDELGITAGTELRNKIEELRAKEDAAGIMNLLLSDEEFMKSRFNLENYIAVSFEEGRKNGTNEAEVLVGDKNQSMQNLDGKHVVLLLNGYNVNKNEAINPAGWLVTGLDRIKQTADKNGNDNTVYIGGWWDGATGTVEFNKAVNNAKLTAPTVVNFVKSIIDAAGGNVELDVMSHSLGAQVWAAALTTIGQENRANAAWNAAHPDEPQRTIYKVNDIVMHEPAIDRYAFFQEYEPALDAFDGSFTVFYSPSDVIVDSAFAGVYDIIYNWDITGLITGGLGSQGWPDGVDKTRFISWDASTLVDIKDDNGNIIPQNEITYEHSSYVDLSISEVERLLDKQDEALNSYQTTSEDDYSQES